MFCLRSADKLVGRVNSLYKYGKSIIKLGAAGESAPVKPRCVHE